MNVLITGAGLLGCYGARRLLEKGHRVVLFDAFPDLHYIRSVLGDAAGVVVETGDVRDLPAVIALFQRHAIEAVLHGAGLIARRAAEHPYTGIAINVMGTINIAEAVRITRARRLAYLSSFGAYNWSHPATAPITEDFPLSGDGLYGATKASNEHLLGAYADIYGFELVLLRPALVFGYGKYRGGSVGGIMMSDLVSRAMRGGDVRIAEAQIGLNEYVYVKDVARAIESACTTPSVKGRVFNIGTGVLTTAPELVRTVGALLPGARIELLPLKAGETAMRRTQPLNLSRAQDELGYTPEYSLQSGLADYIAELAARGANG